MQAKGRNNKKRSKRVIIGIAIGLSALILIAAALLPRLTNTGLYSEVTATKGTIETYYTFTGIVQSKDTQTIMAAKIMQVSEITISEDDRVKKDDVLFKAGDGTEITAGIDGTVTRIYVSPDQQVMAGAPLCEIYDFDNLQIAVKVDEYDLSSVSAGKSIDVTISALDKTISGTVADVSDTAVNQNGVAYFTALVDLENDSAVKPGMTAEARILNEQAADVVILPIKAIQFDDDDKSYVMIKEQAKGRRIIPVAREIQIGINDGEDAEIVMGVNEGEIILYLKAATGADRSFMPPFPRITGGNR